MGDKATLRLARQELEDLYLGVPDDSVDLTFKDLAFPATAGASVSSSLPAAAKFGATPAAAAAAADDDEERKKKGALGRSSTNIFTYRPLEDHQDLDSGLGGGGGLQLSPSSPAATTDHQYHYHYAAAAAAGAAAAGGEKAAAGNHRTRRSHVVADGGAAAGGRERRAAQSQNNNYKRPGIPHSNICALCNNYVYIFRHRCLVCGRVYCRRCRGAGMGDMTEGRKCIDCLGRRYSHRYIHRAGDTGLCGFCLWGYYPNAKAVTAQELIWAEKGPAPRRRPRPTGSSSVSASYDGGYYSSSNTIASASMSMTMNSDRSIAMMKMNNNNNASISGMPASASSSFVASFPHNPHAFPL